MVISGDWFVSPALLLLTWRLSPMSREVAVSYPRSANELQTSADELPLSADVLQRLRWQCRRGMLELDTLLMPFFDEALTRQPPGLQQAFVRLLEASDLELFRWLMRGEQPADVELCQLIEVIREHRASTHSG